MTDALQGGTEWVPRFGMLEVPVERAELIRGLFELAAWAAYHPDLPLPDVTAHVPTLHDGWDAERALVDRVASALEVEPEFDQDGAHYRAERFFGSVRVYCLAIEPEWMAAFTAHSLAARKATHATRAGGQPDEQPDDATESGRLGHSSTTEAVTVYGGAGVEDVR